MRGVSACALVRRLPASGRRLSFFGGEAGETAKAAAAAARAAGTEVPGLEIPWQSGKMVYRQLLR